LPPQLRGQLRTESLYYLRCADLIAPAFIGKLRILAATISALPLWSQTRMPFRTHPWSSPRWWS